LRCGKINGNVSRGPTVQLKYTASIVAALMCVVSLASIAARPSAKASDRGRTIALETAVPAGFGEWTEVREHAAQVVNPQIKEQLDKLYSQLLTRTYVNKEGYRVMLSVAYGDDQRGGLQAHRPEVCYPGQGFKIAKIEEGALSTPFGPIEVRRLTTSLGARNEPVTYWLTVGDQVVNSRMDKRLAEIRLALTGQIPDGLLFRISSIDNDPVRAFATQQKFAAEMMSSVPPDVRRQLSGLNAPASAS
jgi:EpsI family protein